MVIQMFRFLLFDNIEEDEYFDEFFRTYILFFAQRYPVLGSWGFLQEAVLLLFNIEHLKHVVDMFMCSLFQL